MKNRRKYVSKNDRSYKWDDQLFSLFTHFVERFSEVSYGTEEVTCVGKFELCVKHKVYKTSSDAAMNLNVLGDTCTLYVVIKQILRCFSSLYYGDLSSICLPLVLVQTWDVEHDLMERRAGE